MKNVNYILGLLMVILVTASCDLFNNDDEIREVSFEDLEKFTIYGYMTQDSVKDQYTSFVAIINAGGLAKTLQAYNPDGDDYTLFLPNNDAINKFINEDNQISSLEDITGNPEYAALFSRFHVVNLGIESGEFPFGAFPENTLSGDNDFLTVSFVVEADTQYYRINNQSNVIYEDIDASNGYIHLIDRALTPVNFTTYEWLNINQGYSIFREAADLTGFGQGGVLDGNTKSSNTVLPITLLVEPDAVYNSFGIFSLDDLIAKISPNNQDYTSPFNPLYNFVGYHIIRDGDTYFIDDLEGEDDSYNTNYVTLSEVPLRIDGTGLELAINRGKQVFDTIVNQGDTTFIDYVGFDYDESNVTSQSGAIHVINRLMTQQRPSRALRRFEFNEEPIFNEQYRQTPGSHLIDEDIELLTISWSGPELYFTELGGQESGAWGDDYLEINGDFEISYTIPKIIQGKYEMYLRAEMLDRVNNAVVEVIVDNSRLGGFVDLTTGGTGSNPFYSQLIGIVDFPSYSSHVITIRSLVPGRFLWDLVEFRPI